MKLRIMLWAVAEAVLARKSIAYVMQKDIRCTSN
jgi:hypothetical protein